MDPKIDMDYYSSISDFKDSELYVLAGAPFSVFSALRDTRRMNNALADVLLEPEYVKAFIGKVCDRIEEIIPPLSRLGVDALIMADDWGTQVTHLYKPSAFAVLLSRRTGAFQIPAQSRHGVYALCGYNYAFMEDMIDAA